MEYVMFKTKRDRQLLLSAFVLSFLTIGTFFSWFAERILFGSWIWEAPGFWGNFYVYPAVVNMVFSGEIAAGLALLSVIVLILVHLISLFLLFFVLRLFAKWIGRGVQ
jgi:hypothetical protein